MTSLSTPNRLPIDAKHVALQFARRGDLSNAQFLYAEIAKRMDQRLKLIRLQPREILDAGCGAGQQLSLLHTRYPSAHYHGLDHCTALLNQAQQRARQQWPRRPPSWLLKLLARKASAQWSRADLAQTNLPPESFDFVWSNLSLHWHPAPHDVLQEWGRLLRPNGLVFFSCFGPATLKELRAALQVANLHTRTPEFVDMHDFGDLLVEKGFSDPVMDQEVLTLTYETPEKLLADVKALGGNAAIGRRPGLVSKEWRTRLLAALEAQRQADGRLHLTIEVAYGHAWRSALRRTPSGETRISVSAIGRKSAKE
ncbi:methyltransferase domain-containing protein [Alcaligenaceae bacterium LF4-65]|jgi:malonyl-CoA O-methyltransferase|uniref:Malonyl-[acyl-carrier protein] O-methyltransferase n=1 Tax=Zwartia hollandica TaxID=324606 RepID=A0A953N6H5_9BURK|nr:methyltransferase domain-containing protein [Zwartia hollandica]MBZ1349817.1 methyltransferase domain-containing protein [Zwartia hollandica]